ncbi:acyl-homoserine-lactone synthase [Dickeya lacustris]|uniref:Acyl-homoserine-lactone synthase n=1 Tax=Dickeya lacustris TaxID=2259638 RepID=A0ABY8G3H4_9GAMM|nr:acyl-homoserine-lactone synthase [Dickeya lacustris]WFN54497.1 acyl-homoserine-lactone synthase [Dickeya lacustris]
MLEIFDVSFSLMSNNKLDEVFTLRKETFKDRLDWQVNCIDGMEFDEYDNENTTYLLGVKEGKVVCSVRFIEMKYPNMITGTFYSYFNTLSLPEGNYIESSRFFVDRDRVRHLIGTRNPACLTLFLAMINYARKYHYDGILTIVSHPMLTLLKRSGWQISIIEQGLSEKQERIYLLLLPADDESRLALIERITQMTAVETERLTTLPLLVPLA